MRDSELGLMLPAVGQRTIGQAIAAAREAAGLSQSELGRRLKKPATAVNEWESGRRYKSLSLKNLAKIATAIPCSVEKLIEGVFEEYDKSRDLSGHGRLLEGRHPNTGDALDSTTTARLLSEREAHLKNMHEIEQIAGEILNIAARAHNAIGGKGLSTRTRAAGSRRRR